MNIAILGGSFDPPHNGHLAIAKQIKNLLPIDEVWFVPCFAHAFEKKLSSPHHRFIMTKLLENAGIKVSDIEINRKNISLTIETLDFLQKNYPNHTFSWIIGDDQVKDFHKWDEWERIITDYKLIIVPRSLKKLELSDYFPNKRNIITISPLHWQISPVSSTLIRQRVKQGVSITNLVPKNVEAYIIVHELYRN